MFWKRMLTPRRRSARLPRLRTAMYLMGLLVAVCALEGCFFFRTKPDARPQEMASRLSPGMSAEEVLELVGPPQRRGQNLFDKRKEYWIYEFSKEAPKKKRRSRESNGTAPETALASELQLLFERGKLVNWNVVPYDE